MRNYRIISYLAILAIPLTINSCDDNNEKKPDPLVGDYVFSGATFGESVNIVVNDVFHLV